MVGKLTTGLLGGGKAIASAAYAGVKHAVWYLTYQVEGSARDDDGRGKPS